MNSALIHEQMSANGASGDDSLRGTTGNRWQAPVRVSVMCRGQDFMRPRSTGGGRHKLPSFFPVSQPYGAVYSRRAGAGRGLSALSLALPTFQFKTTDHQACKLSDWSPATAHQCASFAATNVAREAINDVEEVCK